MGNDAAGEDQGALIIERAVSRGLISATQASMLREEMFMFPGGNIASIMVRRGMVSADQAKELEVTADETVHVHEDADLDFGFNGLNPDDSFRVVSPQPMAPPVQPQLEPYRGLQAQPVKEIPPAAPQKTTTQSPYAPVTHAAKRSSGAKSGANAHPELVRLFQAGRDRDCSDLHLTVGKPPYLRQQGKIFFLDQAQLTAEAIRNWCLSVLNAEQRTELDQRKQLDFSFECPGVGRFRANVYQQRLGTEAAFRFIPGSVPTLDALQLPKVLEKLTTYPQGLNLVTGPGGCGKTTTVAAMLEYINCHRHDHIITVEDPVEYVFVPKQCQVTQREVGTHTGSFANALRTALRQDPDVIMIGELRDLDTTSISITAAETGHLVFGTLHTSSAARTVARILDVYPPSQRAQICLMIAESLRGIVSQQLIERKDGRGRACAMEILLVTTGVSQVIKEGKTHQLISHMQSGRKLGMVSMDDSLMELLQGGVISGAEAYARAENKGSFEMLRNV